MDGEFNHLGMLENPTQLKTALDPHALETEIAPVFGQAIRDRDRAVPILDQHLQNRADRCHGRVHLHGLVVEEIGALVIVGPREGAVVPREHAGAVRVVQRGVAFVGELLGQQVQVAERGIRQATARADVRGPRHAPTSPVAHAHKAPVVQTARDDFMMRGIERVDGAERVDRGQMGVMAVALGQVFAGPESDVLERNTDPRITGVGNGHDGVGR